MGEKLFALVNKLILDMQAGLYHFLKVQIFVRIRKQYMIRKYLTGSPNSCIAGKKNILNLYLHSNSFFIIRRVSPHLFKRQNARSLSQTPYRCSRNARKRGKESPREQNCVPGETEAISVILHLFERRLACTEQWSLISSKRK